MFLQWRFRAQPPTLIPANISGYTVLILLINLPCLYPNIATPIAAATRNNSLVHIGLSDDKHHILVQSLSSVHRRQRWSSPITTQPGYNHADKRNPTLSAISWAGRKVSVLRWKWYSELRNVPIALDTIRGIQVGIDCGSYGHVQELGRVPMVPTLLWRLVRSSTWQLGIYSSRGQGFNQEPALVSSISLYHISTRTCTWCECTK